MVSLETDASKIALAWLSAQLLVWEYDTVVAGRILGINPFDQPDV